MELGEIVCLATHADAEYGDFGKNAIEALVRTAREPSERAKEVSV